MAPIKSVAVIGAGISGVSSAAHLLRHGFDVVVFERSSVAGGVWHFDPRPDRDPEYPGAVSSKPLDSASNGLNQDIQSKTSKDAIEDVALAHAPPGPCYEGLMNNVPTTMMRSSLLNWPEGTPEHVTHHVIETYVQSLSRETGAHDVTLYNTRVEEAVKEGDKWIVRTKTLHQGGDHGYTLEEKQWTFDAVVVGAGHYHVPLIPNVPGLAEWKSRYPEKVMHSKSYRYPAAFKDKNVLIIGAGVSSLDIAKELDGLANKVYQSSRGGIFDLDPSFLPANSERVSGLDAFKLDEGKGVDGSETPGAPIQGTVHLTDGRILSDIHHVIIASGYQTTYPFLKGLESDSIPVDDADDKIIITADKCVTHNLHKDIFYIPDPTLTFVGVPYYTSTFSMFDFQAEVVARVYADLARLPSEEVMKAEHAARKSQGEKGKAFHSLIRNQVTYMDDILSWVNDGIEEKGLDRMRGVDDEWYRAHEDFKAKSRRLIPTGSNQIQQPIASKYYQDGK
ncbi:Thiol-specific monooxygenase [Cytospora mali]|uniref:Thiol-specific monooxygenase n=1 Tax=Cytospora mali TaxID=578113 RepID=A0A194VBR8_CYTMA|nr:Thiol-specific monooxygenase [Valsa mali var. pyri (nom. inval.)]